MEKTSKSIPVVIAFVLYVSSFSAAYEKLLALNLLGRLVKIFLSYNVAVQSTYNSKKRSNEVRFFSAHMLVLRDSTGLS